MRVSGPHFPIISHIKEIQIEVEKMNMEYLSGFQKLNDEA
jgi:hypothetical protein